MQRLFSMYGTSRESQSILYQIPQMVGFRGSFRKPIATLISLVTHTSYYWSLNARTTGHLVHWNWDCILGLGEEMFTMEFSMAFTESSGGKKKKSPSPSLLSIWNMFNNQISCRLGVLFHETPLPSHPWQLLHSGHTHYTLWHKIHFKWVSVYIL